MRITQVDTYLLRHSIAGDPFWSSQAFFQSRKALLIRVTTDTGLYGWGEAGQYGPAEPVAASVLHVLSPLLAGKDPTSPEVLWDLMYSTIRDFGRTGSMLEALSGLDIALWDLTGKAHGVPIYALMGGAFRHRVRTYATGLYYRGEAPIGIETNLPDVEREASRYMEDGFPAVKAKIGLLKPEEDLRRLELARRILGPDRLLMVDANHAYAAHTAARLARAMEPLDVYWFEEPVEPEDMEGYQQVKAGTSIAIAGGECLQTRYGFAPWISSRAIDIVQPDLACVGGLSEGRRIAALATTYHVQCMPHVWGSGVGVAAGLQFLATLCRMPATAAPMAPYNEPMLEWDANPNPLKTAILKNNIELDNGEVQIPSGPGLGVDVELEEVSRYLSRHETVTFS